MKNILYFKHPVFLNLLIMVTYAITSCVTTNKLANQAISYAIVGQDQNTVYSRLGLPVSTISEPNGEKTLIYEYYSRGMYDVPPVKSNSFQVDEFGNRSGLDLSDVFATIIYDSENAAYETDITYLEVYLDEQGNCVGFRQNLTKEQLQMFREQFKRYLPKDP